MAENTPEEKQAEEQEAAASDGKGGGKIKVLLASAMVLLVIPLIAYIIFAVVVAPTWEEAEAESEPTPKFGKMLTLQPLIVNLADTRGTRYLKAQISLEMNKPTLEPELQERTPQIADLLIDVLSSKSIPEVSDHEGRVKVKQEAIDKINELLLTGKVVNVYFQDFVIQ